jgi:hypothetical protein
VKDANWVGAPKTSTGLGGGILTLVACGAFACTPVNVEPVGIGGSAGSSGSGGSSGSVSRGGTSGTNGGNGGTGGTGGTAGASGQGGSGFGTGGTGGTGGSGTGGTGGGDPGPVNFIANPDFEQGLGLWTMIAQQGTIMRSMDCNGTPEPDPDAGVSDAGVSDAGEPEPEPSHGLWCGRGTNRKAAYQGPAYPLTGALTRGKTYTVSAFGRIATCQTCEVPANADSSVLKLTMRVMCTGAGGIGLPVGYTNLVPETPVTDSAWLFMTGEYTVPGTTECPTMTDLRVYLEGPPADIDILVDDASIYEL